MFLNHLYGGIDEPELKIIDVFICKLRKKLTLACGGENYIETVWGRGYMLRASGEEPLSKRPKALVFHTPRIFRQGGCADAVPLSAAVRAFPLGAPLGSD